MKRSHAAAWMCVAALCCTFSAAAFQDEAPMVARIEKAVNDAEYRVSPTARWSKASSGSILTAGSEIRTKETDFVMIRFMDGSKMAVRPHTHIRILGDISGNSTLNRGVLIERGRAVLNITRQEEQFRVNSPVSTTLIRRGEVGMSFDPVENRATLAIATGQAEVRGTEQDCNVVVEAGHSATIDSSGCRVD
ncbi:MAG: FecR domain-containing protein [Bacteroidota bacterium]